MNRNPLLIKNFIIGEVPFIKEKTKKLYNKYLSDQRLSKVLPDHTDISETLSAYNLFSSYETDFVFDQADVTPTTYFNEKEWTALGMLLRAIKEIEGVSLMHLYNCLYRGDGSLIYGHVVTGRRYTLYSSTQYPVKVFIDGVRYKILPSASSLHATIIDIPLEEDGIPRLKPLTLEFTSQTYPISCLVEGEYGELSVWSVKDQYIETRLVPELLQVGEYSSKLVEFFSGTLITPMGSPELISLTANNLTGEGVDLWDKAKKNTSGWHNKDGYIDRRIKV